MYPTGLLKIDSYQRARICHSHLHGGEPHSACFLFIFSETRGSKDAMPVLGNIFRSDISIVSVGQTEKWEIIENEKRYQNVECREAGAEYRTEHGNAAFAEMRWSSARQQGRGLSHQQHRGGDCPQGGQCSEPARSGGVISTDTKDRLLMLVLQFWQKGET